MNGRNIFGVGFLAVAVCLAGSQASGGVLYPEPVERVTAIKFGDFWTYSLAYLNFAATGKTTQPTQGDPFYVREGGGHIKDKIVIAVSETGTPVNTNAPKIEDAYRTPEGDTVQYFDTQTGPDPTGPTSDPPTHDFGTTWDADVVKIKDFDNLFPGASGEVLGIYFQYNDKDKEPGVKLGQDALAWARVDLHSGGSFDPTWDPVEEEWVTPPDTISKTYFLSAADITADILPEPNTPGYPTYDRALGLQMSEEDGPPSPVDPNDANWDEADPRWAYVHGYITVDTDTRSFTHFGRMTDAEKAAGHYAELVEDLGSDRAAFFLYNEDLSETILNWSDGDPNGYLSATIMLSGIDNGGETLWIDQAVIPEPSTCVGLMGLLAMGLVGCVWRLRKRAA
jgi:hypothetical protein